MKIEIKTKWVEALRSGDYAQAKGRLVKVDGEGKKAYCCLGVLCDLASQEGVVREESTPCGCSSGSACSVELPGFVGEEEDPAGRHRSYSFSVLPWPVMEWAGLAEADPWIRIVEGEGQTTERALSGLNDDGTPFTEIADLIVASL